MSALADPRQLNFEGFGEMKTVLPFDCDVPGTVSATYGTLIVLAISFAIAATGIFLSLLNGIVYTDSIPGALLYYGLLSMRERRYGSSQYYPRYVLVVS